MRLTVRFQSSSYKCALFFSEEDIGLSLLDKARGEVGYLIPLIDFRDHIDKSNRNVSIEVDELIARDSNHFWEKYHVIVETPVGFLNRFSYLELKTNINYYGENRHMYCYNRKILEDDIKQAWREAGYPLEWGFEGEEE